MKARNATSAFTLMELLVVIGIIIILASIMVPAVNALTKGSAQKQAVNTISVYLAAARTQAIAEGRQVGVVFFEDPQNTNQTAMQICAETASKFGGASNAIEFTTFSGTDTKIQYLPRGVRVATLSGGAAISISENATGAQTRAIIFDPQGQLVLRNGLSVAAYAGAATYAAGDVVTDGTDTYMSLQSGNTGNALSVAEFWRKVPWHFDTDYSSATTGPDYGFPAYGFSSPGVFVFDNTEFTANTSTPADRFTWLRNHADVVLINLNTGAVIR